MGLTSARAGASAIAGLLGAFAGVSCGAKSPPPAAVSLPPVLPLDMHVSDGQPEVAQLEALPALWEREVRRSPVPITAGELAGAGNFDEIVGPLGGSLRRNPYLVVEQTPDGPRLAERRPAEAARKTMAEADAAFTAGRLDEALAGYRNVIEQDPVFAKPYFYVAAVLKQQRDLESADGWIERGLRLAPRDAFGYALRAEILVENGRTQSARETLARALALDPYSPPALRLLARLGADRKPGIRPPILVRLEPTGEITVQSGRHIAWRIYALCRALLSYDARVRAEFLQMIPAGVLSPVEETTCGYLVTAAYRQARGSQVANGAGTDDPDLERWSRAFDVGMLREAVIYETLGCRRPELLQMLPDELQVRMVEYARRFVVPGAGPAESRPAR